MDKKKIAFIICSNNDLLLNECLNYISLLKVPENYLTDILVIKDAKSMTSGYNEAMKASDAKYKIYMHQDVFILNTNFLYDIISIFEADSQIGMIGMIGYKSVSKTGSMWHEERYGAEMLYGVARKYPESTYSYQDYVNYRFDLKKDMISEVALIDGFMMITSVDIAWNEEILKDWDFYDAFQSIAFLEHGYKIVVPNQRFPWAIHDDGCYLSMWNYNRYRKKFVEIYGKYLGLSAKEIRKR